MTLSAADRSPAGSARTTRVSFLEAARERWAASFARRSTPPSDRSLAEAARAGDRAAFAELYQRFARAVHAVLLAHGPRGEAQDLVHDVFLSALRTIHELDKPERFGPWLFTIARHRAFDARKHSGRTVELESKDEPAAPSSELGDGNAANESEHVLACIRALPEAYRETLVLRLVEGLSGPEIAQRCGLTHGSVRINLHRGMKLLRARLEEGGSR